ncbi:DUF3857 domain-containing transglutaminase family protein [Biformimicrobium ophioploci]|uniref:DUF3857 domain-containing protein n=1 Tax=Biformimicrobium ophioploci TaxID=3036711 RepID=A0ABQ6LYS9_9GAMM|nr:DUF3857 domain-containing transglutaminase family protein [Microbulbifer sp. NKW57]GMG87202.1 hypothetical protein MNKW57_15230 [Microbulbifer sp. NKW57]
MKLSHLLVTLTGALYLLLANTAGANALSPGAREQKTDVQYSVAAEPEWLRPVAVPPLDAPLPADGSGVRYILSDTQVNTAAEEKQEYSRYISRVVHQSALREVSNISIGFLPAFQKLTVHSVRIHRDGKVIDKLPSLQFRLFQQESQLDNDMYMGSWTAMAILEDVRVGDVVEYSFSRTGSNPVLGARHFGRETLAWNVPVDKVSVHLISPLPSQYRVHAAEIPVQESRAGDNYVYSIERTNVAGVREEDGAPQWLAPYPYFEYSAFSDWAQVTEWATALYPLDAELPAEFEKLVDSFDQPDKLAAAAAIAQWVQDNVRYFGIEMGVNSHKPTPPAETFLRRFGDCKDKTMLLVAALRRLGFDAVPALVATQESMDLPRRLPSPGVFDHVIVSFSHEGVRYWIDPTVTGQRGGIVEMAMPELHFGLLVEQGTAALTEIQAPHEKSLLGSVVAQEEFIVDADGVGADLNVVTTYSGWKAEQVRNYFQYAGAREVTNNFVQHYAQQFGQVQARDNIRLEEVPGSNTLRVLESYRLERLGDLHGGRRVVALQSSTVGENLVLPTVRVRKQPLQLPHVTDVSHIITLRTRSPDALLWAGAEEQFEKNTDWFSYSRSLEHQEDGLRLQFRFRSKQPEVSATGFDNYVEAVNEIEGTLSHRIWMRNSSENESRRERISRLASQLIGE